MLDLFGLQRKAPREHQLAILAGLRQAISEGHRRVVICAPTASGKTFIASMVVRGALEKGNRVAFCVPAIELIDQTVKAFEDEGIERIGVMQGDHPRVDPHAPVQVCSVQTLARRDLPAVRIVIVDEVHVYSDVIEDWMAREPETLFIGLSATPWRPGMKEKWGKLVAPVGIKTLLDRKLLSPLRAYAPSQPDLSRVRVKAGDYDTAQVSGVMSDRALVADVVETWLRLGENRPTLCFAVDRAHAGKLHDEFYGADVPVAYIDAYTDRIERKLTYERFRRGAVKVIVNIGVLTTGFDVPEVSCIVMARPTKSEMLWTQMVGRGMRIAEGKEDCLLLDHTSNILRLGFPADIVHPDLLPSQGPREKKEAKAKIALPTPCSSCGYVKEPKVHACPQCGFTPRVQSKVRALDGELVELGSGTKKRAPTQVEKQLFWSMALHYAWNLPAPMPGMALAMFKERFGEFPRGLRDEPVRPNREWLNWKTASAIRYRKGKEAERKRLASQGVQP